MARKCEITYLECLGGCDLFDCGRSEYLLRESWEFLHSGYYKDVPSEVRSILSTTSKQLSASCDGTNLKAYYDDFGRVLSGMFSEQYFDLREPNQYGIQKEHPLVAWDTGSMTQYVSGSPNVTVVDASISLEVVAKLLLGNKPFVIRGGCSSWTAISEWENAQFWLYNCASRYVPIEIGIYGDVLFSQAMILFSDFVEFLGTRQSLCRPQVYLAQFDLFDRFPKMLKYMEPTPDILHALGECKERNIFLGPSGTISQLHKDPYSNFFCQVVGVKKIKLYDPAAFPIGYSQKSSNTTILPNDLFSISDVELSSGFPKMESQEIYECTLLPGDCIYIPIEWWHSLKSLSVSCSVAHFIYRENSGS